MTLRIEDYALIGDTHTAALIGKDGSVDWLCLPRFDSGSCFAKILGRADHGRWLLAPEGEVLACSRRYRGASMILETDLTTAEGTVRLIDFMPPREEHPRLVRIVQGLAGVVTVRAELIVRFEYGCDVPWVRRTERGVHAIAGPDALCVDTTIPLEGKDRHTVGSFRLGPDDEAEFVLTWHASHDEEPTRLDARAALDDTMAFWKEWSAGISQVHGEWEAEVLRSLITLKALTYAPTGGVVAAPTTSLPESVGGVRNWDYRYCWLRDATLTLEALIEAGRRSEAEAWFEWLIRAAAGAPEQLQIMYGPAGERRLTEYEAVWLPGYEASAPVRIGNAASEQFQLDVYGELMDAIDRARAHGIQERDVVWEFQLAIMEFVSDHWQDEDEGIWEVRGPRRHFTHSKVMAWVAFDRAVRAVEQYGKRGPVEAWRQAREAVHAEVCAQGWNESRQAFVQYFGSDHLDASLLMMPIVGFLPAKDPRVVATIEAIERELRVDGFVMRYQSSSGVDGLPGTEGAFLPCTFWLADCLALLGRVEEATDIFRRLLALANDVGLLAEEYDPAAGRLLGNFPQAFSHVGLINTARNLAAARRS